MSHQLLTRRAFVASMALLPALARPASTPRAPALLLAHEAAPGIDPAGYLVSEKYDGVRMHWDGRELRFRSGLPVQAPGWFVERLPASPLDGEIWLGRGRFEELVGIVRRRTVDDADWRRLRYMVFDLPGGEGEFSARAERIRLLAQQARWPQLVAVDHSLIADRQALQRRLDEVVQGDGEGLMLHRSDARYRAGRSRDLLKLKPLHDAEAQVIAHVAGRGKHAGRLGALHVRTRDGIQFLIGTGFSDAQRESPPPVGVRVSFTHHGFTDRGVPRFASFLRVHEG
ncbi:MAG TPA: DNA ligase [Rubrivivax sp.]|nr:DNA ligase [Rubrivivax sp.]